MYVFKQSKNLILSERERERIEYSKRKNIFNLNSGIRNYENTKNNTKHGINKYSAFSLIELSIVLIIIGLLVAGVSGGASLIKQAKLRSVITEFNKLIVAYNNYYARFSKVPGALDNNPNRMNLLGENKSSIRDLKVNGLLDNEMVATKGIYDFSTVNATSKFRKDVFWYMGDSIANGTSLYLRDYSGTIHRNILSISTFMGNFGPVNVYHDFLNTDSCKYGAISNITSCFSTTPSTLNVGEMCSGDYNKNDCVFTPAEAKYIDEKIDDGKMSGNIVPSDGGMTNTDKEMLYYNNGEEYDISIKGKIYPRLVLFLDF